MTYLESVCNNNYTDQSEGVTTHKEYKHIRSTISLLPQLVRETVQ